MGLDMKSYWTNKSQGDELSASAYSKTCLKQPLKRRPKTGFQDQLSPNAHQKYYRMLQESILQYFWPALSYDLSLRPFIFLFLSGHLRQV